MLMTVAEIARSSAARITGPAAPEAEVRGAGMDSRAVAPGSLFVCIKGSRVDGHDFAAQAADMGAAAILAERELPQVAATVPVLVVDDSVKALGRLAGAWREKADARVVAVTGTAGKTTVKEMILTILSEHGTVCGTKGNYNNQIGLPLTMLSCPAQARTWVLELGISRPGDMEELGRVAWPDLAVITNVGPAHLSGLGDLAGVARAKAALAGFVAPGGLVLASADYPELTRALAAYDIERVTFSSADPSAPFFAAYLGANCTGGRFMLRLDGAERTLTLPFFGRHAAENLAAAAGAAQLCGATLAEVERGLGRMEAPAGRFRSQVCGELTLIDDTYNANPLSMGRSIKAAAEAAGARPLVLVLGEMRELGEESAARHAELGRLIAGVPCAAVFFHGGHADDLGRGLAQAGFTGPFVPVDEPGEFTDRLQALGLGAATILFKGSRSLGMERFLAAAKATGECA